MPARLRCKHCDARLALDEPLPPPDGRLLCPSCGGAIVVRYTTDFLNTLSRRQVAATASEAKVRIEVPGRAHQPATTPHDATDAPTRLMTTPPTQVGDNAPNPPLRPAGTPPPRTFEPATGNPLSDAPPPPDRFTPADPPPKRRARGCGLRFALLALILAALCGGGAWWWLKTTFTRDLPSLEALTSWNPSGVTRVYDRDQVLLGEIYEQRRYVLAYEDIPKTVKDAFVAAEDSEFWEHGGLDYAGILRAMFQNLLAGRVTQGGSTITQQVAKTFLLSNERTYTRKIKEAFLSWRIEAALSKEKVLSLYLNSIFFGSQSYGVEAAARTFFGKHVDELSLGEIAMLAGLPPRPSEWNPHADFDAARSRERVVLDRMVRAGMITVQQADDAYAEPMTVIQSSNRFREAAPWCTEQARRVLIDTIGLTEAQITHDGLQIYTTCDLDLQNLAHKALTDGVVAQDHRLGFRRDGLTHLKSQAAIDAFVRATTAKRRKQHALARDAVVPMPQVGEIVDGVITHVQEHWARVAIGAFEGIIPLAWSKWAYPYDPSRNWKYRAQDSFLRPVSQDEGGILRVGDVITVRVENASIHESEVAKIFDGIPTQGKDALALTLWQEPDLEAALLSYKSDTGEILAMIGGYDFNESQLNRTIQSRRQVGSTFKPFVYTAAIASRKMTAASLVADAPIALGSGEDLWKPDNYGGDFKGNLTLRQALALSRNTCTIRVLDAVDPNMSRDVVHDFARRLGLGLPEAAIAPMDAAPTPTNDHLCPWLAKSAIHGRCVDDALSAEGDTQCRVCDMSIALGSTSLTMFEMARAYGIFARGGTWVQPYIVEQVLDANGAVIYQHEPAPPVVVIEPEVASIAVWLLENVVNHGTAHRARAELKGTLAGKTGTTNDEKDTWFIGFSPEIVTATWVGFDQPRSLGRGSTGGRTALPIWIDFMRTARTGDRDRAFAMAPEVRWAQINEETGERVESGGRSYPFLKGTLPAVSPYAQGQASMQDLMTEF